MLLALWSAFVILTILIHPFVWRIEIWSLRGFFYLLNFQFAWFFRYINFIYLVWIINNNASHKFLDLLFNFNFIIWESFIYSYCFSYNLVDHIQASSFISFWSSFFLFFIVMILLKCYILIFYIFKY